MIDVNLLDNRLIIHESYVVLVKLTQYQISYLSKMKKEKQEKREEILLAFFHFEFFLPLGRLINSTVILHRCSSANNRVFACILLLDFILEKQHPSFLLSVPSTSHTESFTSDTSGHQSVWGFSPHQGKFSAMPAGGPSAVLILPIWRWCRIPYVKGPVSQDCSHPTSYAGHNLGPQLPTDLDLAANQRSSDLNCQSGSQNSGKHLCPPVY